MSSTGVAVRVPARQVSTAPARPGGRTAGRGTPSPALRVVAPQVGLTRARLALVCVSMLVTGLVLLLMLTISLGSGAYELSQLQQQQRQLVEQRQALTEEVQAVQAPQELDRRARGLGMVPAPNTAYLRLSDGAVLGRAAVAPAPPAQTRAKPVVQPKKAAAKADTKKSTARKKPSAGAGAGESAGSTSTTGSSPGRTSTGKTTDR